MVVDHAYLPTSDLMVVVHAYLPTSDLMVVVHAYLPTSDLVVVAICCMHVLRDGGSGLFGVHPRPVWPSIQGSIACRVLSTDRRMLSTDRLSVNYI